MKSWRSFNLCRSLSRSSSSGSVRSGSVRSGSVRSGSVRSGSVRSGHLAVYVGQDRQRFVIPTRFLNYRVFAILLEKAEEEFGYQPAGGLALTCDVAFFQWVIDALESDEERFKVLDFDGFSEIFSKNSSISGRCGSASAVSARSPLIQKTRAF